LKLRKGSNKELEMFIKKLAGLTALAGLFFAGSAAAQISGTAHDLEDEIGGLTDICTICHAPHNNNNGAAQMLWNHSAQSTGNYDVYDTVTLDPGANAGQPGPVSLLCLSCHDGTIAVDSYGTVTGSGNIEDLRFTTGQTAFGTSLENDHPIGLTYVAGVANEMNATTEPVTFVAGPAGTVNDLLFSGVVECASCHDVHATQSGGTGGTSLLRVSNTSSELCLDCHDK